MKRVMKKIAALAISMTMVLMMIPGGIASAADDVASDGSFEGDVWNDGNWWFGTTSGDWWDTASISTKTDAAAAGSTSLNLYFSKDGSVTVNQTIASLAAGTYKLSYAYMGGWDTAAISVASSLAGESGTKVTTNGWGDFSTASDTLTVSEDTENATLTLTVSGAAEAWGYLDSISLVKTADAKTDTEEDSEEETSDTDTDTEEDTTETTEDTAEDDSTDTSSETASETADSSADASASDSNSTKLSEYVVNGGFEEDNIWTDDTAWTFDSATWTAINKSDDSKGTMKISTDAAHTGSSSLQYWFYTGDDGDCPGGDVLIYQTIASVTAGKYYLSGWTMGGEGCGVEISVNGVTVSAENTGWENWVKTDVGTVTFDSDSENVALTVKITGKAGDWGYLDDISLVPADQAAKTADTVNPYVFAFIGAAALLIAVLPTVRKRA